MAAASPRAHSLNRVRTLPIVDDHAAVLAGAPAAPATVSGALEAADMPTVDLQLHGAHGREAAGTLTIPTDWLLAPRAATLRPVSPRRPGRSVVGTDADTMIDYQHRSPTR